MKLLQALSFFAAPPTNLGPILGSGIHGETYEVKDDASKAIKIAFAEYGSFDRIQSAYQFVIDHPHSILATVFEFASLSDIRLIGTYYSATMERLYPLDDQEQRVFKSVVMDYNGNIDPGKCLQHIQELKEWLEFDVEKVNAFYGQLSTLPVVHRDFHRRNIMKDKDGNYKLIDFEMIDIKQEVEQ